MPFGRGEPLVLTASVESVASLALVLRQGARCVRRFACARRSGHSLLSVLPPEKLREPVTFHFRELSDRETTAGMNDLTRDTSWRFSSRVVAAWRRLALCGVACRCLASFGAMWRVSSRMRHRVTASAAKVPSSDC